MAVTEEFPIALAEAEVIEPMMQIPSELPVLPLRDIVIYPFMEAHRSFVGRGFGFVAVHPGNGLTVRFAAHGVRR